MNDKLKVLHLEDVMTDAALVAHELKKSNLVFDHLIIDKKEDYLEALQHYSPDIILCDHSLPSFNSLEALKILKNSKLNIPFILITATMSEEVAERVVKQGADDYVLKDRLKRLPNAVINVLEKYKFEEERKQLIDLAYKKEADAKRSLEEITNKLLLATGAAQIGVWEFYIQEDKLMADDRLTSIYGTTTNVFTLKETFNFLHPEDVKRVENEVNNAIAGETNFDTSFRIILPDHSIRYIKTNGIVIRDDAGKAIRVLGTNQDITQQIRAEQIIKSSEAKYRSFFENSLDAILLTTQVGTIISANPAACQIFQMSEEEICQSGRSGIVDLTDPNVLKLIKERRQSGKARGELNFIRKDGSKFPGELSSAVFTDSYGEERTSMIIRDITERKNFEKSLQQEKERYTDLFLQAPSSIGVLKGTDHIFEMVNPVYLEITGKNNIVGKPVREVFPELEQQGVIELLEEVYKTGKPFIGNEFLVQINKNNSNNLTDIYLNFIYQPYKNNNSEIEGIFFFANDVTEQVQARKKVEESERNYKQLFDNAPLPQYISDEETYTIVKVNDAALKHYGYTLNEFLSMRLFDLRTEEDKKDINRTLQAFKNNADTYKLTANHIKKNGEKIIVDIRAVRIMYQNKPSVLTTITDITEQIKLQRAIADLEISAQMKITKAQIKAQEKERQFIGEELHDNINQQLTTAKLFLDLAASNEEMRMDLIKKSESLVNKTINEIRSLCKTLIPATLKDIGLKEALTELIDPYKIVQKFDIHFEDHPVLQYIDEELKISFFRIVQEQLNNITKYAEAKNIWISFAYNNETIYLKIKDDGKGFNINQTQKGLGVTNTKNRLALYGGSLEITSEPGSGCIVDITVPYKALIPAPIEVLRVRNEMTAIN